MCFTGILSQMHYGLSKIFSTSKSESRFRMLKIQNLIQFLHPSQFLKNYHCHVYKNKRRN